MAKHSSKRPARRRKSLRDPVFVPAIDISTDSLLGALLAVVCQVLCCEKPQRFLRRNVLLLTRKIKVLSLLFEEVKEARSPLPPSAMSGFRSLYVILQKAKFLLEDICCEGSCVWLVMQTEEFSNKFHDLTQEMASALRVIPLPLLNVSLDVKEQVALVADQAARAKAYVSEAEDQLRRSVLTVLEEFEKEVKPDDSILQKIFRELQLESARDCQSEIDLLEDEMRYQNQIGEKQNVSTINSLIGFMRYCKCVLFEVTDMDCDPQSLSSHEARVGRSDSEDAPAIPDDFRCPISLDLMREPVIVSSGQTYELASITRWLEEGHSTCPKSGQKLISSIVIPNYALRNLIIQYCDKHNIPYDKPEGRKKKCALGSIASTKAALEAAKMTAAFLVEKLATGSFDVKKQVTYELRLLAKCSVDNRACIAEAGAIPLLVALLSSDDPKAQENAVTTLLNLSIHDNNKARLMQPEILQPIIGVLRNGLSMEARENAAATLFSLSSTDDNKKLIGDRPDSIPALVELFQEGTVRGKRDAATALFNLSLFNGKDVLAAGAVPLLVSILADDTPTLTDDAVAVLAVLARLPEGIRAIIETSAVPRLISLINSSSSLPKCKENSAGILLSLCCNGGNKIVNSLLRLSSLMPALYNLLTSGTPRAKRKASSLLRILHSWEPSEGAQPTVGPQTADLAV
eukprot:TRINITY_DN3674_c0_g1_i1.p1 TRINITY_DN3674_c0_g1~~TRINITY_DN3674_c0_g1_i1.p1  ORF type:complete len:687 (+),score=109.90 TRINITY_DN3674_c0_g1_i1:877-2937(+)